MNTHTANAMLMSTGFEELTSRDCLLQWMVGNQDAFTELFHRHWSMVAASCRRQLPSDEADDAAQAVFLILIRKPNDALNAPSIEGWLLAVARRVVANAVRGRGSRKRAEKNASHECPQVNIPRPELDALPVLDECLSALSEREREVITQHYFLGHDHEQIATAMGCPKGTVYSLLSRGVSRLRHLISRRGIKITATLLTGLLVEQGIAIDSLKVSTPALFIPSEAAKTFSKMACGSASYAAISASSSILGSKFVIASCCLAACIGVYLGRYYKPTFELINTELPRVQITEPKMVNPINYVVQKAPVQLSDWDKRAQVVVENSKGQESDAFTTQTMWRIWLAQHYYKNDQHAQADEIIKQAISFVKTNEPQSALVLWGLMDCYLACAPHLDEMQRNEMEALLAPTRLRALNESTYNHQRLICKVVQYLSTQTWPQGNANSEHKEIAHWLMNYCYDVTASGSSATVLATDNAYATLPLLSLIDHAFDRKLRKSAHIAFDATLVHTAATYLNGHICGNAVQPSEVDLTQSPQHLQAFNYMYFAGTPGHGNDSALVSICHSFRPSRSLSAIASKRDQPYVNRSRLFGDGLFEYTYINKQYALFSVATDAQFRGKKQIVAPGVKWNADAEDQSYLWLSAPQPDQQPQSDSSSHTAYKFAQCLQHEDALSMAYSQPHKKGQPIIIGSIPTGAQSVITSNDNKKIFLHFDTVLIAISSTEPLTLQATAKSNLASSGRWDLMANAERLGIAIETALPEEFAGENAVDELQAFAATITELSALIADNYHKGNAHAVILKNRHGRILTQSFVDTQTTAPQIDGVQVNYRAWPLIENPWVSQETGKSLLVQYNGSTMSIYPDAIFTKNEKLSDLLSVSAAIHY